MKRNIPVLLLLFSLLIKYPVHSFNISAKSGILVNSDTMEILYEKNARKKMSMASTTKIMTAIVAIENAGMDEEVTVSGNAANVEGSSMYIKAGERYSLESLLYGLMLNSGNDCAVCIAEHVGGTVQDFVNLMNKKARDIGAFDTSFKNPNGLDEDGHYTTAYDLALISSYAMKNKIFREIVRTQSKVVTTLDGEKKYLTNHNKMLKMYEGVSGVKTGFTKASGRCLSTFASNGNLSLTAVTLSAPDDWNDHKSMLDYGFNNFENMVFVSKKEPLFTLDIKSSQINDFKIYSPEEFSKTVKKSEKERYKTEFSYNENLSAPIIKNQMLGKVTVSFDGVPIKVIKILSDKNIEKCLNIDVLFKMFGLLCMPK